MQKPEHDKDEEHSFQEAEDEEEYAALPGGIPKRWLNPALYLFLTILGVYALWVGGGEILDGRKAGIPLRKTMGVIWEHLGDFAFNLIIAMTGGCKILERIMYYLDAKKLAKQLERRAIAAEQRVEEERQRVEEERQRAEEERQRAEQAEQRAERAEQRAEAAEKRAEAAEAKNGRDSR